MSTWSLKVNDPTLIAWFCVFGYSIASITGFLRARQSTVGRERGFWYGLATWCGLLALNKQLDVHSAFLGLLNGERLPEVASILACLVFAVLGCWAAYLLLRTVDSNSRSMTVAFAALFSLVVILAGRNTVPGLSQILGFHLTTETETLLHLHVSELFELGLAGMIWYASRRAFEGLNHECRCRRCELWN